MRMTPKKETTVPMRSIRVKGSCKRMEQAKHDRDGAMNVKTVASASGRYRKESGRASKLIRVTGSEAEQAPTVETKNTEEASNTTSAEQPSHFWQTKGKVRYFRIPHVCRTQDGRNGEAHEKDLWHH